MQSLLGGNKPTASIKAVNFSDLSLDGLTLVFDVEVTNPYSLPLPLSDVAYSLATSDQPFLSGTAKTAGTIPAGQAKTLQLPAKIAFTDLFRTVSGLRPGAVVPYTATMDLSVDAPAVGKIALPLKKSGQLPVPAVPEIELTSIAWSKIDFNQATATLNLALKNTNDFGLDLSKLQYALSLGGSPIASSAVSAPVHMEKGGSNQLVIPISIAPMQLGLGVFNLIRGQGSAYELAGNLDVATPFGALSMPYRRTGQTVFQAPK
jgi:LEA14-like dessication related protein